MSRNPEIESVDFTVAVTPSDSTVIPLTRGLYVGASGDLAVEFANGNQYTYVGLASGITHAIKVRKVLATGTTATSIGASY